MHLLKTLLGPVASTYFNKTTNGLNLDGFWNISFNFWTHTVSSEIGSVSQSAGQSVRHKSSHTSRQVFLAFLHEVEWRKVTRPDFQEKMLGPKLGKKGPKWAKNEVFCHFIY